MKKAIKKICSEKGASVVLAMMIFLMCALAGVSAFTMASANSGRYVHDDEQTYYSVSSAALLTVDLLDGMEYTSGMVEYDDIRSWKYDGSGNKHETETENVLRLPAADVSRLTCREDSEFEKSGLQLKELVRTKCDEFVKFLNVPDAWYESVNDGEALKPASVDRLEYHFAVDVNGDGDGKYGKVNGVLMMTSNYDIILTLSDSEGRYAITVYWTADVSVDTVSDDPKYVYTNKDESGNYTSGSATITQKLTVNVKWTKDNVTISRGEAMKNESGDT